MLHASVVCMCARQAPHLRGPRLKPLPTNTTQGDTAPGGGGLDVGSPEEQARVC